MDRNHQYRNKIATISVRQVSEKMDEIIGLNCRENKCDMSGGLFRHSEHLSHVYPFGRISKVHKPKHGQWYYVDHRSRERKKVA